MQEANDFQIDFLKPLLEEYHFIGQRSPAPDYWQDNVIFYKKKWKCSFHERFFLSHTPSVPSRFADSKWPRQCVIGFFEKPGDYLICANTHFDFDPSVQKQSAEIIIKQLNDFQKPEAPVIITGDFNAKPGSLSYQEFTSKGFFREIFHGEHSGTYHGFTGECMKRHIDWILYKGPVELMKKEILTGYYHGGFLSDHFPVLAQFRAAKQSSCPETA
jgi:endonuclease/exonuclease/phosphatase family metal-dependent hydrolase